MIETPKKVLTSIFLSGIFTLFSCIVYAQSTAVEGQISGLNASDTVRVSLGNDQYLSDLLTGAGPFRFDDVPPGHYFVKLEIAGYTLPDAKEVSVDSLGNVTGAALSFQVSPLPVDTDQYTYSWAQDNSRGGKVEQSNIVAPRIIEFLNEPTPVLDLSAAHQLLEDYNILLSDEGVSWSGEFAARLLATFKQVPLLEARLSNSKWILTDDFLANDIEIQQLGGAESAQSVSISSHAFAYAQPRKIRLDGIQGRFYSKRLHHALVSFVTQGGADEDAVEYILNQRFGVSIRIPDYAALTGEDPTRFQAFHPNELVTMINMFEELPEGLHVIPALNFLVRRVDGQTNPIYPAAPAVAWTTRGYIEFMEIGFLSDIAHLQRLILHEKSHFMWAHLFSESLRNDWIAVGGWYLNPDDPDGWSTTEQTTFVSAYAHKKNPNEDMAESISFYVLNPNKLLSRAPDKYNFIRDYIMHGTRYVAQIREDLTFEVLNLMPDYNYPGKINSVNIKVDGKPEEDKEVTIEIDLTLIDKAFDGASSAYLRINSEIGTFIDLYLYPTDPYGAKLSGRITIPKSAKAGYWRTDQIIVSDLVGNQRFEGVDDFGWLLYIDNPQEDVNPPQFVPNSLFFSLNDTLIQDRDVQKLTVSWEVDEDRAVRADQGVYARIRTLNSLNYSFEAYGQFNESTKRGSIDFLITEYYPTDVYAISEVVMIDAALNTTRVRFSEDTRDQPIVSIPIQTSNEDDIGPTLSLNNIYVSGEPTHPEAPDGETLVRIEYYAKDDLAGLGVVNYRLLDPQGISHFQYHYHENFYNLFFEGDPTAWTRYEINVVLPKGSAPGIWGLQTMELKDKAGNRSSHSFVEILRFDVAQEGKTNGTADPPLRVQAEATYTPEDKIKLDWEPIESDILSHYQIYRDTTSFPAESDFLYAGEVDTTSFLDTDPGGDGSYVYRITWVDINGNESSPSLLIQPTEIVTSAESEFESPNNYSLLPNYPNPFNPTTLIRYELPGLAQVRLEIYNLLGQRVRTLVNVEQSPGIKTLEWDATNDFGRKVTTGVYFMRLQASTGEGSPTVITRKMTLLK